MTIAPESRQFCFIIDILHRISLNQTLSVFKSNRSSSRVGKVAEFGRRESKEAIISIPENVHGKLTENLKCSW